MCVLAQFFANCEVKLPTKLYKTAFLEISTLFALGFITHNREQLCFFDIQFKISITGLALTTDNINPDDVINQQTSAAALEIDSSFGHVETHQQSSSSSPITWSVAMAIFVAVGSTIAVVSLLVVVRTTYIRASANERRRSSRDTAASCYCNSGCVRCIN